MYKVRYYTVAKMNDGTCGNIEQFRNTYFTENEIQDIPKELQNTLDVMYSNRKTTFVPVIMEIELLEGHGERKAERKII
jgi:hypothetical protein